MQQAISDRWIRAFRIASIILLMAATLFFILRTITWRWQWDTTFVHYVSFLIDSGKEPYRDIIDMNMPGTFFMEKVALAIFGPSDVGWRLYEFSLLAVLTGAMMLIAKPVDWLAGLFAGVIFTLVHGTEGANNAAQREEILTVLVLSGIAFAFISLRRRSPWLMLPFGFLVWLPISLKPTIAPLGFGVLILAMLQLRRRKEAFGQYLLFAITGFAVASAVILSYLIRHHALLPFLEITRNLLNYYGHSAVQPLQTMFALLLPRKAFYLLLGLAIALAWRNGGWRDWERQTLVMGVCFGFASYMAQRKGFAYHRYPMLAFLFLWIALEFCRAAKLNGWIQKLGLAGLACFLLMIPGYCRTIYRIRPEAELMDRLVLDLQDLGGTKKLQNSVQCLDVVHGCFGALYRLGIIQATGFTSDFMLFGSDQPAPPPYPEQFFNEIRQHPPQVIVMTNARLPPPDSFDKLDRWPEFASFLNDRYTLKATRWFPRPGSRDDRSGRAYRLYVLRNP